MRGLDGLHDLLLRAPLDFDFMRALLFFTFYLHFVFVLLMLGTAMVGIGPRGGRDIFRPFTGIKSLAVVFGVGPILLMQTGHAVPFLNAVNRLAPLWMSLVLLIVTAFLMIEGVQQFRRPSWSNRFFGYTATAVLLIVPGIFSATLMLTEHPEAWGASGISGRLLVHWGLRYLHVLGAALVFGGLAHGAWLLTSEPERGRALLRASLAGLLFQIFVGVALFGTLPLKMPPTALALMLGGVLLSLLLAWDLQQFTAFRWRRGTAVALGLLVFMLGTRQALQDSVLVPAHQMLSEAAGPVAARLRRYEESERSLFLTVNHESQKAPETVYMKSCSFCHGVVGNGQGPDARYLKIPPADLTEVRGNPAALRKLLLAGVEGTAMPGFPHLTRPTMDGLLAFLDSQFRFTAAFTPIPVRLEPAELKRAGKLYAVQCAVCHGERGVPPEQMSAELKPPPRDLTQLTRDSPGAFRIISKGSPGTAMTGAPALSERERWALVALIHGFYDGMNHAP